MLDVAPTTPTGEQARSLARGGTRRLGDARRRAAGFGKNDGDNEITGMHVSDGDPGKDGILGAKVPHVWHPDGKWRFFYTQQHGDNATYEVVRAWH